MFNFSGEGINNFSEAKLELSRGLCAMAVPTTPNFSHVCKRKKEFLRVLIFNKFKYTFL